MPLLLAVYPTQEERRIQGFHSLVERVRSKLQWSLFVFPCQICIYNFVIKWNLLILEFVDVT